MCLIIAPGADKPALLPRNVFDFVYAKNDDGFGAMWVEDGRVQHIKGLSPNRDEEYEQMQRLTEAHPDIVFHMRYRTHGETIPGLSHPFRILHKNRHGHDLFFMHNGVLGAFGNNLSYGQSDTTVFKDKILVPLLTRNPDALDDPETFASIEKLTSGSRLIFMRSDGKTWITSKNSWNNRYGLTLSNTYMLPYEGTNSYSSNNVTNIASSKSTTSSSTAGYTIRRCITTPSNPQGTWHWCRQVCPGLVRTEGGQMYRDRGVGVDIVFDIDFVPGHEEFKVMSDMMDEAEKERQKVVTDGGSKKHPIEAAAAANDSLDDPLPWADDEEGDVAITVSTKSTGQPADLAERLRYARLVHNCHSGNVSSRVQLFADLTCMSQQEFAGFVKEDPTTATAAFEEILDMLIEMNELLAHDPTCEEFVFDTDELLELGDVTGNDHMDAMKSITVARRAAYEAMVQAKQSAKGAA